MAHVKKEMQIKAMERISQLLLFSYIKGKGSPAEMTVVLVSIENVCFSKQCLMIRDQN